MVEFQARELKKLFKPASASVKGENGRVTIIGGSRLFHGAPLLALKTASRIVDMVFFSSPEPSVGAVAAKLKSKLGSFIWVPFKEVGDYLRKSDAILIGPGLMRYQKESQSAECHQQRLCGQAGYQTKKITETLLRQFPQKQWVIDGGSLQVMAVEEIPEGAILTPNQKEFKLLFGPQARPTEKLVQRLAKKYRCFLVLKLAQTIVASPERTRLIKGGNPGLTKGGTGDVLAGLTVALAAKNPPFLAACAASWVLKKAADELYQRAGFAYNADDLAEKIPEVLGRFYC